MSLSRAFTYAGCPSLVMSLWSVPDESTAQIISTFFQNLKEQQPKDTALQQAKLSYLQNAPNRLSHPLYWAGFVPVGEMKALNFPNSSFPYQWLLLILAGFPILFLFKYLKNR